MVDSPDKTPDIQDFISDFDEIRVNIGFEV